jgi:glycosyl transferase family 87
LFGRWAIGTVRGRSEDQTERVHKRPLVLGVFLALMYLPFLLLHLNTRKNDFSAVYVWSTAARQGLNPYAEDLTGLERRLNLDANANHLANYPPPLIIAFEPFTLMPPAAAYWVWFAVSLIALGTALGLLLGVERLLVAVPVLLYEPLTDHFLWAQSYTVILLLFAVSFRAMATGRDAVAGGSLAAAGALKIFPLVVLLYAVRTKRWRVVFSAAAGLLAISVLSISLLGWNCALSFLRSTSPSVWAHWAFADSNVSIGAIIAQWVIPAVAANSPSGLWLIQSIFIGSALVLGACVFWTTPAGDPDLRAFGLWIITATWIFPICWPAHMVLFLGFLAVLFRNRAGASTQAKWVAVSSFAIGAMLLPVHWILLSAGPIGWLSAAERTCLIVLVLSTFYAAWLFARYSTF